MNINFQKPSTLTDGMVRSFVKACFLDRRIRNGQVSNLPTEIAAILKQQGSPHIELTRVLGIADKMLTGTPLGLFNTVESRAFLKEQLIQFLANCEKDSPAAVEYILSNGTISLYIYH
ncbi:MAG: hypothetical protein HYZ79_03085, partial [Candidatus Melainabacteria bacterium]|nr:hypothetical protein [Candidatus Melainabacteria bacterium]